MASSAKQKGNSWEREICKFLGETLGGNFQRVPSAGCFYVYSLWRKDSDKPFYIGKGKGNRFENHFSETKESTINIHKFNIINSEREKGIPIIVKFVCENVDELYAYELEEYLIKFYGRYFYDEVGCLTNICIGNRPPSALGRILSEETKEKMRGPNPKKGNHGEKNGFYGKHHSDENKQKFAEIARLTHSGVKRSEEQKNNMKWSQDHSREVDRQRMSLMAKANLANPKFKEASRLATIKRNKERRKSTIQSKLQELKTIISLIDEGKSNIEIGKTVGKTASSIWHVRAGRGQIQEIIKEIDNDQQSKTEG